jgi:hypothetical protein
MKSLERIFTIIIYDGTIIRTKVLPDLIKFYIPRTEGSMDVVNEIAS